MAVLGYIWHFNAAAAAVLCLVMLTAIVAITAAQNLVSRCYVCCCLVGASYG